MTNSNQTEPPRQLAKTNGIELTEIDESGPKCKANDEKETGDNDNGVDTDEFNESYSKPTTKEDEDFDYNDCKDISQSDSNTESDDNIEYQEENMSNDAQCSSSVASKKRPLSKSDSARREQKLARNRMLARERRKKKRLLIEQLQNTVAEFTAHNQSIREQNVWLSEQIEALNSGSSSSSICEEPHNNIASSTSRTIIPQGRTQTPHNIATGLAGISRIVNPEVGSLLANTEMATDALGGILQTLGLPQSPVSSSIGNSLPSPMELLLQQDLVLQHQHMEQQEQQHTNTRRLAALQQSMMSGGNGLRQSTPQAPGIIDSLTPFLLANSSNAAASRINAASRGLHHLTARPEDENLVSMAALNMALRSGQAADGVNLLTFNSVPPPSFQHSADLPLLPPLRFPDQASNLSNTARRFDFNVLGLAQGEGERDTRTTESNPSNNSKSTDKRKER